MQPIDAALQYAAMGWPVFPCRPFDKRPATAHGVSDATTDVKRILHYWQRVPNANIGLATGKVSGIWVLDVDTKDGKKGSDSMIALVETYGSLPHTRQQRTGSGGWQYMFVMPDGIDLRNSAGKIGPDIDVRGNGGYVVIPPSIHPCGDRYRWIGTRIDNDFQQFPILLAPDWLVALAIATPQHTTEPPTQSKQTASGGIANILANAGEGERNNRLFWAACRLFDHGCGVNEAEAELLPIAIDTGLTEREILATIRSAGNQERRSTARTTEQRQSMRSPEQRQRARARRLGLT